MRGILGSIAVASFVLAGCASNDHHVTLNDIPSAPRAAIEREAAGGTIEKVERETRKGMVVYEADIMVNGKKREVKVDENGRVVSAND